MITIKVRDNQPSIEIPIDGHPLTLDLVEELELIANKKIKHIACDRNPNFFVFPPKEGRKDGIDDLEPFFLTREKKGERDYIVLTTGNFMGFLGTENISISISSRFSEWPEDEERAYIIDDGNNASPTVNDFFLYRMLEKVLSLNVITWEHLSKEDNVLDLLMFFFPVFLQNALKQGLFKQYRTLHCHDIKVKGVIDVPKIIKYDTPFAGKLSYSVREYSSDNDLTELIRHTIEFMKCHKIGKDILRKDKETKGAVQQIVEVTEQYAKSKRSQVIKANLKPINHPFFQKYAPLRKLCLAILRRKKTIYDNKSSKRIYGVVFDGSWLWEEYLCRILPMDKLIHPRNKTRENTIYQFEGHRGPQYPDFYSRENRCVLDAKYKRFDESTESSPRGVVSTPTEDRHQLISYLYILEIRNGISGFLYPARHEHYKTNAQHSIAEKIMGGGTMTLFGLYISKAETYQTFKEEMADYEKRLKDCIDNLLSTN